MERTVVPLSDLMRLIDKVVPLLVQPINRQYGKPFLNVFPSTTRFLSTTTFPQSLYPMLSGVAWKKAGSAPVFTGNRAWKTWWVLSRPYIAKFGDERNILSPVARCMKSAPDGPAFAGVSEP